MSALRRILIDGQTLDVDVTNRTIGLTLVRTMDGAASLELALHDPDYAILGSGVLARAGKPNKRQAKLADFDQAAWARFGKTRLTLDGWAARLAGANVEGTQLTLTFEDEAAALLRNHTRKIESSRADLNRAQFVHMLVHKPQVAGRHLAFFSPQQGQRQKIAEPDQADRKRGIHPDAHITVKDEPADAEQRRNMETVLTVADELGAGERATLAMIVANIGEALYRNTAHHPTSQADGLFQMLPSTEREFGVDSRDMKAGARIFLSVGFTRGRNGKVGAIQLAAQNPDMTPGEIASKVEGSDANGTFYDAHLEEAEKILAAWGGAAQTHEIRETYEFTAGGEQDDGRDENYWSAIIRLAATVRWRGFADQNIVYFVSDEWLFQRRPAILIRPGLASVQNLAFNADIGEPIAEINATVRTGEWTVAAGATVSIEDLGPMTGRWLVWEHRQDLLAGGSQLILRRPAPALAEPAPTVREVTDDVGDAVPLPSVKVKGDYSGTKSIFEQVITPFMAARGLETGSEKRTPEENRRVGGSDTSDHLSTNTRAYAVDYPTTDGAQAARELARHLGYREWKPNEYAGFSITVGRRRFRVQILWGAQIDHNDHVHVGITREG